MEVSISRRQGWLELWKTFKILWQIILWPAEYCINITILSHVCVCESNWLHFLLWEADTTDSDNQILFSCMRTVKWSIIIICECNNLAHKFGLMENAKQILGLEESLQCSPVKKKKKKSLPSPVEQWKSGKDYSMKKVNTKHQ